MKTLYWYVRRLLNPGKIQSNGKSNEIDRSETTASPTDIGTWPIPTDTPLVRDCVSGDKGPEKRNYCNFANRTAPAKDEETTEKYNKNRVTEMFYRNIYISVEKFQSCSVAEEIYNFLTRFLL